MLAENIAAAIAAELHIKTKQTEATIRLLDENNTVPFIARYRKEATGELDEEQLRTIEERLGYLRSLVKRQEEILGKIAEQGKLTPELQQSIEKAAKLQELEDLYLPYKQKKRTRAQMAREKGLEPLAAALLAQAADRRSALEIAAAYTNEEKGVSTPEEALQGAIDIAAETIMEDATLRKKMRQHLWQTAEFHSELDEKAEDSQKTADAVSAVVCAPVPTERLNSVTSKSPSRSGRKTGPLLPAMSFMSLAAMTRAAPALRSLAQRGAP